MKFNSVEPMKCIEVEKRESKKTAGNFYNILTFVSMGSKIVAMDFNSMNVEEGKLYDLQVEVEGKMVCELKKAVEVKVK